MFIDNDYHLNVHISSYIVYNDWQLINSMLNVFEYIDKYNRGMISAVIALDVREIWAGGLP